MSQPESEMALVEELSTRVIAWVDDDDSHSLVPRKSLDRILANDVNLRRLVEKLASGRMGKTCHIGCTVPLEGRDRRIRIEQKRG